MLDIFPWPLRAWVHAMLTSERIRISEYGLGTSSKAMPESPRGMLWDRRLEPLQLKLGAKSEALPDR